MTDFTSVDFDPFASATLLRSAASTESQRELWTAAQLGSDASAAFNEAVSLRLLGPLDRAALEQAYSALVSSHEALHTSFSADGASLLVEEPHAELLFEDLVHLEESERRCRVAARLRGEVSDAFELTRAPLCRARLFRLAPEEHLLLLTAHHIVCDGWSMAVVLNDFGELYSQIVAGAPSAPLPRPNFSDYAEAERAAATSDEHRRAERYWLDRFREALPIVDLPSDRARPAFKTYASDRIDHRLDAELVHQLKALGRRHGATFLATLLSGFNAFVHRLTGAQDLVVGLPAAGQLFTDRPNLVGHCVNLLPIRSTLDPEWPFVELLRRTRDAVLDASEHQQLTFGSLLTKLALPRDPSRLPLVSLSFNLDQAVTGENLCFASLTAEVATTPRTFENFDLFVNAAEKHGGVTLEAQYNTDLFDRRTVVRWLEAFEQLLRGVASEPAACLRDLSLVTANERARLDAWNAATSRAYPRERALADYLLEHFESYGDRIAVDASDGAVTYAELDRRSRCIAEMLLQRGLGRGALVGIALERTSQLVAAVLGVLRAGAAYVPLDPTFPAERLTFMAEDSQLSALVTERRLDATLFAPHVTRCFLDDVPLAVASADGLGVRTLGEDPAYVLYTSGSTGKPKGVVVPQRAVVNFLASMAEAPGFSHQDRLLAVTTLSFDISVLELLLPLSVGGTVVLATSSDSSDGGALRRLLHDKHVSVLQATPATWRLLLAAGEDFYPGFKALCGGEPLPKSLADELIGLGVELWNMYGPTETTVWSTCQRIASGTGRISIGRPIANTQVHILDDQQRIVPVGVTGELCIAGDGVTLGYLRRPELTAERFVTNPYGAGRLYRTGDLARYLPDGTLECLGRNDSQVKLRGYRIELGEIESVLSQLLAVQQAVVMVREDRPGDQRLVAYLVPTTEMPPLENLRNELRRALPEYMVPGQFVELASIPLTPNGKIDRKRLPAPVAPSAGAEAATAETQSERLLQRIWQRALGVSQISATDDFFQLGGHSLLAAQLVAQISRETGIQLPMRRVFEAPTLRGLAKVLDDERRSDDTPSSGIARRQEQSVSPLSSMQQRLWFIEEMNPGTSLYNLPSSFRLSGALNRDALQRALNTIAERHTALRTTFQIRNGEIVQALSGKLTFDLTPIDLRQIPREERELKLRSLLSQAAAEPFNLRTGPLARAALFLLAEDESVLFFMPHHAVWDGWSFDVFLDELDQLYAAYCRGEPSPLTDLPVTYGDFAAWQQSFLGSPENARQTRFWLDQLSGELPVLELPTDAPRPSRMSFAGATEPFELDAALLQELSQLAVANGATLYMMLLAAFYAQLFRLTGQDELIVGTPVRGRNRPELEGLLGFFVNTLALRRRVDGHESFVSLLARVREACVQAFGHQEMPFELLMQKLPIARDLSRTPVYSAFFTFQDVRNRKSSIGDLSFDQLHVHAPVSPTDVSLWVKQLDSKLVGGLDYATDIIQRDSAARWVAAFQRLLTEIVLDPKRSVFELVAVPPAERLALEAISNTSCDYPRAAYLHQLIEAQVDRTPHAVAAVCGAARVTYAELDERANRLARALRQRGAQPGSRVGICLERSLDLLVAALAVQKSGAAYVPLDPNFPAERLQFMANDANVSVMLVHERTRAGAPLIEAADVLDLDADRTDIASCDGSRIDGVNEAAESAPLYVIYTSGSSGKPKGVVVPHRAVVNFVTSMAREPGIHSDDRLLAVTTLSFDIAVLELYAPLTVGAQVVIASREMIADGDLLDEAIDEHEITIMQATPSTWRLLLAAGFRGGQNFRVLCGGEAFPRDLAEQLLDVAGEVWNLYGPTETTVWSTCQRLERPLERITIGRPIANTSVHVVDARGQLVPWGSEGELWIGGDGVALGYHARQELTADRFVANPFRPGRVYKTGDLVRLRSNGELEYLRRNDNQVKLRGYRIELGEVEAALGRVPGVRQAVALVREDRTADHRLVAYLTTTGGELSETALRQELRAFLPEYMIPQHIVMLDAFPLTPNGKIDRRALPSPEGAVALPLEGYLPPRTEKEKLVATLWQEVLGVDRVSARDNFFDIGGHSLLCLQMTARLEQRTGTRVNPRVVLRNDLSQIAALLPDASPALPPPAAAAAPSSSSLARRLLGRLTGR